MEADRLVWFWRVPVTLMCQVVMDVSVLSVHPSDCFSTFPKTPKWTWSEEGDDEEQEEEEEGGGTKKAGGRIEGQRWGRAGEAAAARG